MDIVTAKGIPEGATLVRAYWSAPHGYVNPGPQFVSEEAALYYAIRRLREDIERHENGINGKHLGALYVPLPERITIDLRWYFEFPRGGGLDTVVVRTEFKTLIKAEEHLARLTKYAKVV